MTTSFIDCLDHIIIVPEPYRNGADISWTIETESTCVLLVSWLEFSLEENYEVVFLTDLESNEELWYTGSSIPAPVMSQGSVCAM
jgi:hypothetical protein